MRVPSEVPLTPLAVRALGSTRSTTARYGESNPAAKLSDEDVRAIRAAPRSDAQLALEYRVARALIRGIRTRRLWPHIV